MQINVRIGSATAAVATLLFLGSNPSCHAQDQGKEFPPLIGPVVIGFDEDYAEIEAKPFGIFRDDSQRPAYQYIEEKFMPLRVPGGDEPLGFNVLMYNVSGRDSYNGWWVKLGGANWSRYRNGELVFRLRRLDPAVDEIERSIQLAGGDTQCTTEFKVELKTQTRDGRIRVVGLGQRLTEAHRRQQEREGYFDFRIPLADFSLDLRQCYEITIVFENSRIKRLTRGALGIHAIVLTSEPGQNIDRILQDGTDKREGPI